MATTPEGKATVDVLIGASTMGMRLMRNNSGAMQDHTGRLVHYGLGTETKACRNEMAFGDQVGITPLVITPEMVGKTIGVFTMMEVKPPNKLAATYRKAVKHVSSREGRQLKAINWVRENGGIAWFASCADDVKTIYDNFIQELKK